MKMTQRDYLASLPAAAPIPQAAMTCGEAVDLLDTLAMYRELEADAEWLNDEPAHIDTGIERDGAATGISQPQIY